MTNAAQHSGAPTVFRCGRSILLRALAHPLLIIILIRHLLFPDQRLATSDQRQSTSFGVKVMLLQPASGAFMISRSRSRPRAAISAGTFLKVMLGIRALF